MVKPSTVCYEVRIDFIVFLLNKKEKHYFLNGFLTVLSRHIGQFTRGKREKKLRHDQKGK